MTKINQTSLDGSVLDQSRLCGNLSGLWQEMVKQEIEPAADGMIDRLVYELYGLSEDKIKIVES